MGINATRQIPMLTEKYAHDHTYGAKHGKLGELYLAKTFGQAPSKPKGTY